AAARLAAVGANPAARRRVAADAICELARGAALLHARRDGARPVRPVGRSGRAALRVGRVDCVSADGDARPGARNAGLPNVGPNAGGATLRIVKNYHSKLIARLWRDGLLMAVALSALSLRAQADGGLVRLRQTAGSFVVTVFAAPSPPRVGPVEISVLAQNREDGQAALDVEVFVRLRSAGGTIVVGRATREVSRNKLLYS